MLYLDFITLFLCWLFKKNEYEDKLEREITIQEAGCALIAVLSNKIILAHLFSSYNTFVFFGHNL